MSLFQSRILTDNELQSLANLIAEMEKQTRGEIRVAIRHRRHWKERKLSLHDLALSEFRKLGMAKTRDRTGVLIMLLLSDRQFQIIADEGIHTQVEDGTWEKIAGEMSSHFQKGHFADGIGHAIRSVGTELAAHFPRKADDTNELPDDIVEE